MARDGWDTTERRRDWTGAIDRTYTREGETKVYRSLLEVARAHYPGLLAEAVAPAPEAAAAPKKRQRFEGRGSNARRIYFFTTTTTGST